jgi:hypothetical protein
MPRDGCRALLPFVPASVGASSVKTGKFTPSLRKAAALDIPEMPGLVGDILPTSGTTCAYKKFLVDPAFEAARYAHRQYPYGISDRSEMRAVWAARPHGVRLTPSSGQAGLAPTGGRRRDYPHTIDLSCPADFGGLPERYR